MNSTRALGGKRLARQTRVVGPARRSLVVRAGAERVTQSKDDIIVSPSILSANFSKLGEQVRAAALRGFPVRPALPVITCRSARSTAAAPRPDRLREDIRDTRRL